MSEWLKLVNGIKRRPVETLLTPSQKTAYAAIIDLLRYPKWINLSGAAGSGKTLVAWSLARATGAIHVVSPSMLEDQHAQEGLLIDSAPNDEAGVRRILARCNLLGARSVVLITQQPIAMPMARVELSLPDEQDVRIVMKSFALLGYRCDQARLPASPNLWNILQASV